MDVRIEKLLEEFAEAHHSIGFCDGRGEVSCVDLDNVANDIMGQLRRAVESVERERDSATETLQKWIAANAAASTLLNEQLGEIKRLRGALGGLGPETTRALFGVGLKDGAEYGAW